MAEPGAPTIVPADEAAARAARRAGVEVAPLEGVDDLRAVADLFDRIWGTDPAVTAIPVELLKALAHTGCYVAGARDRDGDRIVGGSVGFFSGPDAGSHLHSHIAGVDRAAHGRGIGFALKQHQRAWALARGVDLVSWTFDPLVRRNAWFNLAKLGAVGVAFRPEFYGAMADAVNAGDESDRLVVAWHLADERVARAAAGPDRAAATTPAPTGATIALHDDGGQPRTGAAGGAVRLAFLPADIERLRREDPAAARTWRLALREVLQAAFDDGLRATGMTAAGALVLAREDAA